MSSIGMIHRLYIYIYIYVHIYIYMSSICIMHREKKDVPFGGFGLAVFKAFGSIGPSAVRRVCNFFFLFPPSNGLLQFSLRSKGVRGLQVRDGGFKVRVKGLGLRVEG
jgi:hypothetical protein